VAPGSILFCLPSSFSHQISVAQQASFSIDVAFKCGQDCSTLNSTEFLVRPIILNRLVNAQKSKDYLTSFLDKRLYYSINTRSSNFDTVLNYKVSKYHIDSDSSFMPFENIQS
jgi:hypothetical protein